MTDKVENLSELETYLSGITEHVPRDIYETVKKTLDYQGVEYGFERTVETGSDSISGEHLANVLEAEGEDRPYDVKVILTDCQGGETPRIEIEDKKEGNNRSV